MGRGICSLLPASFPSYYHACHAPSTYLYLLSEPAWGEWDSLYYLEVGYIFGFGTTFGTHFVVLDGVG